MIKKLIFSLILTALYSCSHVTLEIRNKQKIGDELKNITYIKSYENKNATLCYVTAIFWGGACWFHLVYPTVNQEALFLDDLKKDFENQHQVPLKLEEPVSVKRIGWSYKDTQIDLK